MSSTTKPMRFLWRMSRNVLSAIPVTRRRIFPRAKLSENFGRGDVEYAWNVFQGHYSRLVASGYTGANSVLEVGPGRNIGTSLLWWAAETARKEDSSTRVVLWDVFANARIEPETWRLLARELLATCEGTRPAPADLLAVLSQLAHGSLTPNIAYLIGDARKLRAQFGSAPFELIYSQAAIEHAWHIENTWRVLRQVTKEGGWHSHRIDLADHGSRETNYVEMLEWSDAAYWLTMRFVPGAINRWRAFQHVDCLRSMGFDVLKEDRETRSHLPRSSNSLAGPFRRMSETELRTTAVDLVARLSRMSPS